MRFPESGPHAVLTTEVVLRTALPRCFQLNRVSRPMETSACQRFKLISKSLRRTPCKRYSNFTMGNSGVCTAVTERTSAFVFAPTTASQFCGERRPAAWRVNENAVMCRATSQFGTVGALVSRSLRTCDFVR
jgi:hypothetical protein